MSWRSLPVRAVNVSSSTADNPPPNRWNFKDRIELIPPDPGHVWDVTPRPNEYSQSWWATAQHQWLVSINGQDTAGTVGSELRASCLRVQITVLYWTFNAPIVIREGHTYRAKPNMYRYHKWKSDSLLGTFNCLGSKEIGERNEVEPGRQELGGLGGEN